MTCQYCEQSKEQQDRENSRKEVYKLIVTAEMELNDTIKTFARLRQLLNSKIDADEVDYNFHDVVGRITDTLNIQARYAFDLHDQGDNEFDV